MVYTVDSLWYLVYDVCYMVYTWALKGLPYHSFEVYVGTKRLHDMPPHHPGKKKHVYMYVYICVHFRICRCRHTCTSRCICEIQGRVCVCVCSYAPRILVCFWRYTYLCVCTYIGYICIYIIYIHKPSESSPTFFPPEKRWFVI